MKLQSYFGPAGIQSLTILQAVEAVIFSNKLFMDYPGIKPKFLNAAHGAFPHLAASLSFSKLFSHQSFGNLYYSHQLSPVFACVYFCPYHFPFTLHEFLLVLHTKCDFPVKFSHLFSHCRERDFVGTQFNVVFHIWKG